MQKVTAYIYSILVSFAIFACHYRAAAAKSLSLQPSCFRILRKKCVCVGRALTPLFGNAAGAHGIGKISGVLTKIGKFDIVLMYDVSIARLIPIIKLTLVYYEKRHRKKQVLLYSIILRNCKHVTICSISVFILYEIKMENQKKKKKNFFFQIGNFLSGIGKKTCFLALGMGPGPKIG